MTNTPKPGYTPDGAKGKNEQIDSLKRRIDKLKQLRDDLNARALADPTLVEFLEEPKKMANIKLAALEDELAKLNGQDVMDQLDVKKIMADIEAASAAMVETFSASTDPQFAGSATILASAYDVLITHGGNMPSIFTGRPFADACKDFSRVRLLFQHDPNIPIGVIEALWETDAGLWAKVRFSRTPKGEEIAQLCRDGALCEASIGFNVKTSNTTKREGTGLVRVVTKAELADVSVVTWGANPAAKIVEAAGKVGAMEYADANWRTDLHEAEALMSKLDGKSTTKSRKHDALDFDFFRGRVRTPEEREQQDRSARMEKMYRALAKDPALCRMDSAALAEYLDAIEV